jgi:hypothetical protein
MLAHYILLQRLEFADGLQIAAQIVGGVAGIDQRSQHDHSGGKAVVKLLQLRDSLVPLSARQQRLNGG